MKLEYLENISDNGKFKNVFSDNLIRIFDFTLTESKKLINLISENLLKNSKSIELNKAEFVTSLNCSLALFVSNLNLGILKKNNESNDFECHLSKEEWINVIEKIDLIGDGYNWLCEESEHNIDFLYSNDGWW